MTPICLAEKLDAFYKRVRKCEHLKPTDNVRRRLEALFPQRNPKPIKISIFGDAPAAMKLAASIVGIRNDSAILESVKESVVLVRLLNSQQESAVVEIQGGKSMPVSPAEISERLSEYASCDHNPKNKKLVESVVWKTGNQFGNSVSGLDIYVPPGFGSTRWQLPFILKAATEADYFVVVFDGPITMAQAVFLKSAHHVRPQNWYFIQTLSSAHSQVFPEKVADAGSASDQEADSGEEKSSPIDAAKRAIFSLAEKLKRGLDAQKAQTRSASTADDSGFAVPDSDHGESTPATVREWNEAALNKMEIPNPDLRLVDLDAPDCVGLTLLRHEIEQRACENEVTQLTRHLVRVFREASSHSLCLQRVLRAQDSKDTNNAIEYLVDSTRDRYDEVQKTFDSDPFRNVKLVARERLNSARQVFQNRIETYFQTKGGLIEDCLEDIGALPWQGLLNGWAEHANAIESSLWGHVAAFAFSVADDLRNELSGILSEIAEEWQVYPELQVQAPQFSPTFTVRTRLRDLRIMPMTIKDVAIKVSRDELSGERAIKTALPVRLIDKISKLGGYMNALGSITPNARSHFETQLNEFLTDFRTNLNSSFTDEFKGAELFLTSVVFTEMSDNVARLRQHADSYSSHQRRPSDRSHLQLILSDHLTLLADIKNILCLNGWSDDRIKSLMM